MVETTGRNKNIRLPYRNTDLRVSGSHPTCARHANRERACTQSTGEHTEQQHMGPRTARNSVCLHMADLLFSPQRQGLCCLCLRSIYRVNRQCHLHRRTSNNNNKTTTINNNKMYVAERSHNMYHATVRKNGRDGGLITHVWVFPRTICMPLSEGLRNTRLV